MGYEMIERLDRIGLPESLKELDCAECEILAKEIRRLLICTVSENGGHLASNLGTVELSIALHRVFDSPDDKLVWDVGHQSYTHKILTGRYGRFDTIRKENGLSGFCRPDESVHDAFISGHSSNSVSAALGIAEAMKLNHDDHHVVAVIGDGAFTGGLSFEGLNNAAKSGTNLIVVLNNNEMSISKNVGGLAKYLSTLRTKESYKKTKSAVERILDKTPLLGQPLKNTMKASKDTIKKMMLNTTLFEDLGFEFVGPINGHNIFDLEEGLKSAKAMKCPVLVHVNTVKGKGYAPAEKNPGQFHGVSSFELKTGNPDVSDNDSFSSVFGKELSRLADSDERICAVTAAMKYGTGLNYFSKDHRERFFDVGIAEAHALTFCGGLASQGKIPVFAVYSSFLQRGYDQLIHDISEPGYHVVLGIDRAGVVGEDGITHQGLFDVSFLSTVPGTTVYSPSTYTEMKMCLKKALFSDKGISAVRYPKGNEDREISGVAEPSSSHTFLKNGSDVLIITYGRLFNEVYRASKLLEGDKKNTDILKLVNISDISDKLISEISRYSKIFFFEECYYNGSVSQRIKARIPKLTARTVDSFVEQASISSSLNKLGLSADKIYKTLKAEI